MEAKEFSVNKHNDLEEVMRVVMGACKEVFRRTGGAGFPVLCICTSARDNSQRMDMITTAVQRAFDAPVLIYHEQVYENWISQQCCSEADVETWLENRRNGEEKRCLITDHHVSRGWEASHTLVIALTEDGLENLVMRTVGYCALVKIFDPVDETRRGALEQGGPSHQADVAPDGPTASTPRARDPVNRNDVSDEALINFLAFMQ